MPLFFFNDTAPTEIYTLSLPDALPISPGCGPTRSTIPTAPSRPSTSAGISPTPSRCTPLTAPRDPTTTRPNPPNPITLFPVLRLENTITPSASPTAHPHTRPRPTRSPP